MCFYVFLMAVISAVGLTVLLNTILVFTCYFILFVPLVLPVFSNK